MLGDRLDEHDVPVWLVNTGWTGGPYGVGERMNINHTRSMVRAALSGALRDVPTARDPIFDLAVPTSCPDVPAEVLQPRGTWADPEAYDRQARELQAMFERNYQAFEAGAPETDTESG
jgi:phosphoenolpyruvate carboxykinase (ATP)